MTPSQLNKKLESLQKKSNKINEKFIRANRGNERPSDIWNQNDKLSQEYKFNRTLLNNIQDEITRRYGPNIRRAPTRQRNPVGPTQSEVDAASDLFKEFTGDRPEGMKTVKLPVPKTGLVIGKLDGVLYTTVRDGKTEKYQHDFKKSSRPHLISSYDGTSLHILGGGYEFTERGIVDKS